MNNKYIGNLAIIDLKYKQHKKSKPREIPPLVTYRNVRLLYVTQYSLIRQPV